MTSRCAAVAMEILTIPIGMDCTIPHGMVKRKAITDWEDAALRAIAAHGLDALSIPDLARGLGVTKGSFYWHFDSLQALVAAALRRWESMDREALDELRPIRDPRARLEALFVQSMQKREAHALYVTLGLSSDPAVAAAVRRVSERRLAFLLQAYRQLGLPAAQARARALLAYTAYVGALHLRRRRASGLSTEKHLAAYVAHAVRTLIPARLRSAAAQPPP
jgi:AcrR family transcriptional regulator